MNVLNFRIGSEADSSVHSTNWDHSTLDWLVKMPKIRQQKVFARNNWMELFAWLHTPKCSFVVNVCHLLVKFFGSCFKRSTHSFGSQPTETVVKQLTLKLRQQQISSKIVDRNFCMTAHTKTFIAVNAHHLWSSWKAASSFQLTFLDHITLKQWWKNKHQKWENHWFHSIQSNKIECMTTHIKMSIGCECTSLVEQFGSCFKCSTPSFGSQHTETVVKKHGHWKSDNNRSHQKKFNEIVRMTAHTKTFFCCERVSFVEQFESCFKCSTHSFGPHHTNAVVKMWMPKIRQQQISSEAIQWNCLHDSAHTKNHLLWTCITFGVVEKLLQAFIQLVWNKDNWNGGENAITKNQTTTDFAMTKQNVIVLHDCTHQNVISLWMNVLLLLWNSLVGNSKSTAPKMLLKMHSFCQWKHRNHKLCIQKLTNASFHECEQTNVVEMKMHVVGGVDCNMIQLSISNINCQCQWLVPKWCA